MASSWRRAFERILNAAIIDTHKERTSGASQTVATSGAAAAAIAPG
jgi:hypothetical protein